MRMPMADSLLALIGTFFAVTALILARGGADALVWAPFVVAAAVLVVVAAWDARRAPVVLLVGEDDTPGLLRLEGALEYEGCAVRRCTGPVDRHCPVLSGEPCPYGNGLLAAVVRPARAGFDPLPCDRGIDAPVLPLDEAAAGRVATLAAR